MEERLWLLISSHLALQTLRDFQYVDRDGRDQGANVREKARQLVCLLRDEERLHQERSQALKTKERMAGGGSSRGGGSGGGGSGGGGGSVYGGIPPSYHPGRRTSQPSMAVLYGEELSRSRGSPSSFNCEFCPSVCLCLYPHLQNCVDAFCEKLRPQIPKESFGLSPFWT